MRPDLINELEKAIVEWGFSEATAVRAAWLAQNEFQSLRYEQVAIVTENKDKTPVDVYMGVLSGKLPWVCKDYTIEEAALGSLLPHIPDDVRKGLTLTAEWRIERDSSALCITLSNRPHYFDSVVLYPRMDEDDSHPRLRLDANDRWCGSWKLPAALYHQVREWILFAVGKAVVWRKPLPQVEEVERLLEALSDEAAKKLEEEERGGAG